MGDSLAGKYIYGEKNRERSLRNNGLINEFISDIENLGRYK
jgi:hypothetical protein